MLLLTNIFGLYKTNFSYCYCLTITTIGGIHTHTHTQTHTYRLSRNPGTQLVLKERAI